MYEFGGDATQTVTASKLNRCLTDENTEAFPRAQCKSVLEAGVPHLSPEPAASAPPTGL